MGLLDELAKALEEAQQQAEGRRRAPAPSARDERSEADIDDEDDGDDVVVRRARRPGWRAGSGAGRAAAATDAQGAKTTRSPR